MKLVEEAISKERPVIGIVTQRDARTEDPGPTDLYMVGCAARILKVIKLAKDNFSVILQGVSRIRLVDVNNQEPFMTARVQPLPDPPVTDVELDALGHEPEGRRQARHQAHARAAQGGQRARRQRHRAGQLADLITSNLDVQVDEKQDVLETFDLKTRLRKVLQFLSRQHEVLKVREKINSQVQEEMGRNQREYVLRQQLKAIKEELGEIDESGGDLDDFREKIAALKMPPETEKVAEKQLERLKVMQPVVGGVHGRRTYLEWLVDACRGRCHRDKLDLQAARNILDEDHYDLEKVKERILEYLAVRKLKTDKKGPILCFVGPPGVGKTSLGRSIAAGRWGEVHPRRAGRRARRGRDPRPPPHLRRLAAGPHHPGHASKAGTNNPVFMLDEIDKLGHDFRGDPSAALLEVLDPAAEPHVHRPLPRRAVRPVEGACSSRRPTCMDPIPPPLRDRMEVLELPGYTREEKLDIAKQFLIPKQLEEHGLSEEKVVFEDAALRRSSTATRARPACATSSARSANVVRAHRRAASPRAKAQAEETASASAAIGDLLGPTSTSRGRDGRRAGRRDGPGLDAGRRRHPLHRGDQDERQGQLVLTGQLGDVMKESAQAALSFIRSRARWLGLEENFLEKTDIHVHVPAGAIPKDGPSAGVTMFVAMASLLTNKPIRNDVAMTGEITLRGLVLPVGGIKEKFLAAHRAGIKRVILPERNRKDVVDIPEQPRNEIEILFVKRMDELLPLVLTEMPKLGVMSSAPVLPTPAPPPAA